MEVVRAYEGISKVAAIQRVQAFSKTITPVSDTLEEALARLDARNKDGATSQNEVTQVTPPRVGPINKGAAAYLMKRGFNKEVADFFRLGVVKSGYMYGRIFIPVFYRGNLVTYQARSIKPNPKKPYLFPSGVNAKRFLYNLDEITPGWVVVVEGVTDAWAVYQEVGRNVVATFGKDVTKHQVRLLLSDDRIKEIIILFDNDYPGRRYAVKLAQRLNGCKQVRIAKVTSPGKDPADVPSEIVPALMSAKIFKPKEALAFMVA